MNTNSYSSEFWSFIFTLVCDSCEDRCPFHTRTCASGKPACVKHCRFPKEKKATQGLHSQENPWFNFCSKFSIPIILNSILLLQVAVIAFSPPSSGNRKKSIFQVRPTLHPTAADLYWFADRWILAADASAHQKMERRESVEPIFW